MSREFDKFKNYNIIVSEDKNFYEIHLEDCDTACYVFPAVLDRLDEFLEVNHLDNTWAFIPYIVEHYDTLERNFSEEMASKNASQFIPPEKCLDFFSKNNIIDLLQTQKPDGYRDMLEQVQVLMNYWKQGYYVYSWG